MNKEYQERSTRADPYPLSITTARALPLTNEAVVCYLARAIHNNYSLLLTTTTTTQKSATTSKDTTSFVTCMN
eukprot:7324350-Pyramimonas_sp.AAC.1